MLHGGPDPLVRQPMHRRFLKWFVPPGMRLSRSFVRFLAEELPASEKLTRLGWPLVLSTHFPPFPSRAHRTLVRALRAEKAGHRVPGMVNLSLTNRCPYDCIHCSNQPMRGREELNTQEWLRVIHQLQEMGTYLFGFTGGEPLERPDLLEILGSVDRRSTTILYTTGRGLDAELCGNLRRVGLRTLNISLHHSDRDEYDRFCRFPGAWDTALEAIRLAREEGLVAGVSTVATRERIRSGELEEFLRWSRTVGVEEVTIFDPFPVGAWLGNQEILLTPEDRQELARLHLEGNRRRDMPRVVALSFVEGKDRVGCLAGTGRIFISARGDVSPCDFVPLSFGDVRQEPLPEIFQRMTACFASPSGTCINRLLDREELGKALDQAYPAPLELSQGLCLSLPEPEPPLLHRCLVEPDEPVDP